MVYRERGFGPGVSLGGLGIGELAASKRTARGLSMDEHDGVVRAFGTRELLAGGCAALAAMHRVRVGNRVVCDAMDIAALGLAARRAPHGKAL